MAFKITIEREKCIGCGTCNAICPANWELKEDGKAMPINAEVDVLGCNKLAEENCPTQCIHIETIEK